MKRVIILLLDSFGVGALPDANKFGDEGGNTFLHIAETCARGDADQAGLRHGPLHLPNLNRLGLGALGKECAKKPIPNFSDVQPKGLYGYAKELSFGKDTPSGHWEIAGVPVLFDWGYFPSEYPSFPEKLINEFILRAKIPGVLGNKASSGTVILDEFGEEHMKTGKPIVYTSADSVFQIACHEETFGLERLYELCKIARQLVDEYNIGRVIARPFLGEGVGRFKRTGNRKDYSVLPPASTVLDKLKNAGGDVIAVGKIDDIFAHQGITEVIKATGNKNLFDATVDAIKHAGDRSLIFTNFVDFDMEYGHRRNIAGYAHALEEFDERLPEIEALLKPGDLVVITADHGCDPTFKGTDHTREHIPVMIFGPNIKPKNIGCRETFADIGQSIAAYFDLEPFQYGETFLE
jgi:phosphopentomutase